MTAQMAGVDPVWALVELNIWRSPPGDVRAGYETLRGMLERARGAAA